MWVLKHDRNTHNQSNPTQWRIVGKYSEVEKKEKKCCKLVILEKRDTYMTYAQFQSEKQRKAIKKLILSCQSFFPSMPDKITVFLLTFELGDARRLGSVEKHFTAAFYPERQASSVALGIQPVWATELQNDLKKLSANESRVYVCVCVCEHVCERICVHSDRSINLSKGMDTVSFVSLPLLPIKAFFSNCCCVFFLSLQMDITGLRHHM